MARRKELKVNEVAKQLAAPGFTEPQAAAWFRKLSGKVFPAVGEIGSGAKNHGLYDPLVPAAATIIRALWEMGVQNRDVLRHVYDGLIEESSNAPGRSWIAHILDCVASYPVAHGLPALVVTQVFNADDESIFWRVDVFDLESQHFELPENQHRYVTVRVNCALVLRRFAKAAR